MKMEAEHYEELKKVLVIKPQARQEYEKQGLSDVRYVWDLFFICVPTTLQIALYGYLYDTHIQTALLKILGGRHEKR